MRTLALVLLLLMSLSTSAMSGSGRLGRIHAGMTRTDVAIELGRPVDVRVDDETMLWLYPSSESEICTIRFVKQKVTQEVMTCDQSEQARKLASSSSQLLKKMNSEKEYEDRVQHYCGLKPVPRPGCRILPQCVNGGWEEVCN